MGLKIPVPATGATARWRFEGSRIDAGPRAACTGRQGQLAELLLVLWRGMPARCDDAVVAALNAVIADMPGIVQSRAFCGQRDGRNDYLGVVESGQPFDVGSTDTERYSTAVLRSDGAHVFNPI